MEVPIPSEEMTDEASRFSAPLLLALLPEDALVLFPLSALDADAPLREALPLALLPLALAEVAALGMLLGTGLLALEMVTIAQSAASTVSRQERGGRDSRPIPVVKRHVRYLLDDAAPDTGRRVVDYRLNLISP